MKRIAYVWLAATISTSILTMLAGAQSEPLGDYARAVRKEKKQEKLESGKRFDNDNLPKTDTLSVVGKAADQSAPNSSDTASQAAQDNVQPQSSQKADDSAKMAESKPGEPAKDRQKMYDEWKNKINLLAREMDVMQREYRLRAAAFYADAGNRLRNAGSWDKEDAQYKQQLAEKQKTLDTAKEELQDSRERARKAGVPSSMIP